MGLLDVLNGMRNGPRGQQNPSADSGGMSPITMAVLALLAYKAYQGFNGQPGTNTAASGPATQPNPGANDGGGLGDLLNSGLGGLFGGQTANAGGGLGGLLSGGLGGLLAGGAAGSVLSGGLNDLLKQFQQNGQGDVAKSWVDTGPNQTIAPDDLAKAIGADQIDALTAQTGLSRDDLLAGLSQELPEAINQLTPDGRLPTEQELSRLV
jgi:uncharacterized protein YidB (DUF937 family)